MTFDTYLINQTLLALGITVGIAILMALAITGIAAIQLRRKPSGRSRLTAPAPHARSERAVSEHGRQAA